MNEGAMIAKAVEFGVMTEDEVREALQTLESQLALTGVLLADVLTCLAVLTRGGFRPYAAALALGEIIEALAKVVSGVGVRTAIGTFSDRSLDQLRHSWVDLRLVFAVATILRAQVTYGDDFAAIMRAGAERAA